MYRSVYLQYYTARYRIVNQFFNKVIYMAAGRNRAFDKQQALESAMRIFWSKGYAGASLTDLTGAMNINKPSMYAAFGNKEQLFIQSLQNYIDNYADSHSACLNQEVIPMTDKLRQYMMSIVAGQCNLNGPSGCFLTVCVSELSLIHI